MLILIPLFDKVTLFVVLNGWWHKSEVCGCDIIGELQAQVSRLAESERSCREQVVAGNSRNTTLKAKLSTSLRDLDAVQAQLQESSQRVKLLEQEKNR